MDWFPLALTCAFMLASADAFTKKFFGAYSGAELLIARFGVPALLLLPLALLNPLPPVPPAFWGWVAALVPLELVAMLLYMVAIRDSPLHLTLPYLAFTPVFNALTGYLVLGESVSRIGLGGVLLVVAGAYLLNLDRGVPRRRWWAPFAAILRERGSRLMLAVASLYSLTSVMGKRTMQYATPETFGAFYYTVIGLTLLLLVAAIRPAGLRVLVRNPGKHLLVGALMSAMVVTHFLAIAQVEVAYFIAVKRTSLLFGIVYGVLLFREGALVRHFFAGALMVAGVVLILM